MLALMIVEIGLVIFGALVLISSRIDPEVKLLGAV